MLACLGEATLQRLVSRGKKWKNSDVQPRRGKTQSGRVGCLAHKKDDRMGCHHKLEPGMRSGFRLVIWNSFVTMCCPRKCSALCLKVEE